MQSKMRRLISISLALMMLLISLKVSVDFHYCCGKLTQSKIVIGFGKASCGMDEPENSCKTRTSSSFNKAPCCENHLKQITIDDFQYSVYPVQSIPDFYPVIIRNLVLNLQSFEIISNPDYKIPPEITSVSLPVIGVFLI